MKAREVPAFSFPLHVVVLGMIVVWSFGCSFDNYHTFSNTRKLLESDVPGITKIGFGPIVAVQEAQVTPVTIYLDATEYAERNQDVYHSYLGMQTLIDSPMHGVYKALASLVIIPVDSSRFPVAGTIDTLRVINRDTPDSHARPPFVPSPPAEGAGRVGRGWGS